MRGWNDFEHGRVEEELSVFLRSAREVCEAKRRGVMKGGREGA